MSHAEIAGFPTAFWSEHEAVVVKPPGVASELTSDPRGVSVIARIRAAGYAHASLPHRLDRVTRGYLVVALSEAGIRFHGEQIRARDWSKYYLARIAEPGSRSSLSGKEGRAPTPVVGESDRISAIALLGEHRAFLRRRKGRMEVVRAGGQPSFLRVHELAPAPGRQGELHVVVELLTGRFHQIRAMLANLGAPLVGDVLYGGPRGPFYLEHAILGFRPYGREAELRLFDPEDPGREPVAPEIATTLLRVGNASR